MNLTVENRSDQPVDVIWSDTRLEGDWRSDLILATPGSRTARKLPQAPTKIQPDHRETFSLIPGPPGRWQPFTDDPDRGFWQRGRSLFDLEVDEARNREELAHRAVGHDLRLVLTIRTGDERHVLELPVQVTKSEVRATYY